jgi:hypothetical protein
MQRLEVYQYVSVYSWTVEVRETHSITDLSRDIYKYKCKDRDVHELPVLDARAVT